MTFVQVAHCAASVATLLWTVLGGSLPLCKRAVLMFTLWNMVMQVLSACAFGYRGRVWHATRVHSVVLVLVFWSVYAYDRELILSRHLHYSAVLNHLQHTVPLVWACLIPSTATNKLRWHLAACVPIVAYLLLLGAVRFVYGMWPYAFLNGITFPVLGAVAVPFTWACSAALL